MITLCTLFNVNYLDKGLTMYESLEKVSNDFTLYILAMDDKCYEILNLENRKHIVPIKLSDFENKELLSVKEERTMGEYCWTCSSSLIKYIFKTYNPDYCAYIDADIYFYSDPSVIIEEMIKSNASVQITGHRFNKYEEKEKSHIVGKYCVEYNTFKNDKKGNYLLDIWIKQCMLHCSIDGDGIHWGDQKYMDNWTKDYSFVIETKNMGLGVAPWNINQYSYINNNSSIIKYREKIIPLVMYHFENIHYIDKNIIKINIFKRWNIDKKLVNSLYIPYLSHIDKNKQILKEKYNIDIILKKHPGVNIKQEKKKHIIRRIANIHNRIKKIFLYEIPQRIYKDYDIINLE